MLRCRDPKYGFLTYKCPNCGEVKTIPLTCKSRICTSCGKKHADEWAEKLAQSLHDVPHRHMVFTIPDTLRPVLEKNHQLLRVLMDAVSLTMKRIIADRKKATPGVICVLHPYGKDLGFNPHVHVLATEGGLTKRNEWVNVNFFEYGKLRRIWQYELLTSLKANMPNTPETSQLINNLFKTYQNGFYVYAEQKLLNAKKAARYIGRYIRHPAIAESRITNFDEKANTVTFWYTQNGKRIETTITALEFIDKLVKLIPDKNFKLIRYYGAYSRKTRKKLHNAITALTRDIPPLPIDEPQPVTCSKCGTPMQLISITRPT